MEHILSHLVSSISDQNLSSSERKVLKAMLTETPLSQQQRAVLRSKMYDIAHEHIHAGNYRHILEWLKDVTSALQGDSQYTSDAFFSPGDSCRNTIIHQVNQAVRNLKICVFTISDDLISNSILTAFKKGVSIQIITDNDKMEDEGSDINKLAEAGISIKIDHTPNHMHHKFMVVDEKVVLTGSYNWTRSAALYNHENVLLTYDPGITRSYLKEFSQLWKTMKDY